MTPIGELATEWLRTTTATTSPFYDEVGNVAIVSGRRARRPDGATYRTMRRQGFSGGGRRSRGGWAGAAFRLLAVLIVMLAVAAGTYFAWQRFRPH